MGIKIVEENKITAFPLRNLEIGKLAVVVTGEHEGSIVTSIGGSALVIEIGVVFCPKETTFVRPLIAGERLEIT